MRKRTIALFVALASMAPLGAAAATGFRFHAPDGWIDLSPGAPAKNFERLAPEVAAQMRAQHVNFYAADLDHAEQYLTNMTGVVTPGAIHIDESSLDELARQIAAELKKQPGNLTFQMTRRELLQLDDVTVARYVGDLTVGNQHLKQVGYLLPGHDEKAILTFSTVDSELARYQQAFDAAARATTGLTSDAYELGYRIGYVGARAAVLVVLIFGALVIIRRTRARAK
jgi:hypothetical protein